MGIIPSVPFFVPFFRLPSFLFRLSPFFYLFFEGTAHTWCKIAPVNPPKNCARNRRRDWITIARVPEKSQSYIKEDAVNVG